MFVGMPLVGIHVIANKKPPREVMDFLVAGIGFEPMTFGLCILLQFSLPRTNRVWSLDFLFTLPAIGGVRGSAIKSLHLLRYIIEAWLGITIVQKASPNLTEFIQKLLSV